MPFTVTFTITWKRLIIALALLLGLAVLTGLIWPEHHEEVHFGLHDDVMGRRIYLDDMRSFEDCVLLSAPGSGTVVDGVVNPHLDEIQDMKPCPIEGTRAINNMNALGFAPGDTVAGAMILRTGKVYHNCILRDSPDFGVAMPTEEMAAFVNPRSDELTGLADCHD